MRARVGDPTSTLTRLYASLKRGTKVPWRDWSVPQAMEQLRRRSMYRSMLAPRLRMHPSEQVTWPSFSLSAEQPSTSPPPFPSTFSSISPPPSLPPSPNPENGNGGGNDNDNGTFRRNSDRTAPITMPDEERDESSAQGPRALYRHVEGARFVVTLPRDPRLDGQGSREASFGSMSLPDCT
jgi:hypothetical protein